MTITIGSNIASLGVEQLLEQSSSKLSSVFKRLASGLRINQASDDAAGLAVASSLNADSRVYTAGIRNVSDGESYLNIMDGAIGGLKTILFRLRELATQSSNGTYSDTQRQALQSECGALRSQWGTSMGMANPTSCLPI
jgi:flagellin